MKFPTTKSTKNSIREAIGFDAVFVIQGEATACSRCESSGYYDAINETSLDSFCPVCSGIYWFTDDIEETINSHVRWTSMDNLDYTQTGYVPEGDCTVTISVDELTQNQIDNIKEIVVDSRKVEPYKIVYRGVPTRDRVRIYCKEFGKG